MKICVAQVRPVKGEITRNIENHKALIDLAVARRADTIIFPELSLTGYEPTLAKDLVTSQDDSRFDVFQKISDAHQITIGVGAPTRNHSGICISMVLFQPHEVRQTYSKKYIHADEEPFFVSGQSFTGLIGRESSIALAICYELSIPQHSEDAFERGARIYVASVAKSARGAEKASKELSDIARRYSMITLMSNCLGYCDDFESAGQSAIWNREGLLLGQLDDANEGILVVDTETMEVTKRMVGGRER
jgi:predicted amidohydrolase